MMTHAAFFLYDHCCIAVCNLQALAWHLFWEISEFPAQALEERFTAWTLKEHCSNAFIGALERNVRASDHYHYLEAMIEFKAVATVANRRAVRQSFHYITREKTVCLRFQNYFYLFTHLICHD
jgi:hypothetical protein